MFAVCVGVIGFPFPSRASGWLGLIPRGAAGAAAAAAAAAGAGRCSGKAPALGGGGFMASARGRKNSLKIPVCQTVGREVYH